MSDLARRITELFEQGNNAPRDEAREVFLRLRDELSLGKVRAADPDASSPTGWRVNVWVKQGILLGFRFGDVVDMGVAKGRWSFFDKDTLPMRGFREQHLDGRKADISLCGTCNVWDEPPDMENLTDRYVSIFDSML